jgi:hypothetical protein
MDVSNDPVSAKGRWASARIRPVVGEIVEPPEFYRKSVVQHLADSVAPKPSRRVRCLVKINRHDSLTPKT